MNYLEKEREQQEIQCLIAEDKEEELAPDYCQYVMLKWKERKK